MKCNSIRAKVVASLLACVVLGLGGIRLDQIVVATRVVGGDTSPEIRVHSSDEVGEFEQLFEQFRRVFVDIFDHLPELQEKQGGSADRPGLNLVIKIFHDVLQRGGKGLGSGL